MVKILEPKLYEVCFKVGLEKEYAPFVAILTASKLISAGLKMRILNFKVAKELLFLYFILGTKVVPYPMN